MRRRRHLDPDKLVRARRNFYTIRRLSENYLHGRDNAQKACRRTQNTAWVQDGGSFAVPFQLVRDLPLPLVVGSGIGDAGHRLAEGVVAEVEAIFGKPVVEIGA